MAAKPKVLLKPKALEDLKPVTRSALAFAFFKFQFKFGACVVGVSVIIFLFSEFLPFAKYFAPKFTDRGWYVSIALFAFGVALCGKEVVNSFTAVFREIFRGTSKPGRPTKRSP